MLLVGAPRASEEPRPRWHALTCLLPGRTCRVVTKAIQECRPLLPGENHCTLPHQHLQLYQDMEFWVWVRNPLGTAESEHLCLDPTDVGEHSAGQGTRVSASPSEARPLKSSTWPRTQPQAPVPRDPLSTGPQCTRAAVCRARCRAGIPAPATGPWPWAVPMFTEQALVPTAWPPAVLAPWGPGSSCAMCAHVGGPSHSGGGEAVLRHEGQQWCQLLPSCPQPSWTPPP